MTFPLKQGGIAAQQADVVAAAIAAEAGANVDIPAFEPVLRVVLLTGKEPNWLRGERSDGGIKALAVSHTALRWPPT